MSRLIEVFRVFLKLGLTSFGGPVAHIGYFREEFVARRRWLDDATYADLVALGQFLPGPASSQVIFAIGLRRAGFLGGLVATLCFTLPSALVMLLFAMYVTSAGDLLGAGWLHGLKAAAVAVVAQAVWGMATKLCPDRTRGTIALVAAVALLAFPGAAGQIGAILGGAIAGWLLFRHKMAPQPQPNPAHVRGHAWAVTMLLLFFVLLFGMPLVVAKTGSTAAAIFDSFYRSGSLVFGGGHVVLPLLRAEVVPRGWVTDDAFLAGYGAAQALPGPLFTFAGYLGAVMQPQPNGWLGWLWCLVAIFLPALLLMGGALPFWEKLRGIPSARAALQGTNAAVVGILLAALYDPVWTEGIKNPRHLMVALGAFGALALWRLPQWLMVVFAAIAGALWL